VWDDGEKTIQHCLQTHLTCIQVIDFGEAGEKHERQRFGKETLECIRQSLLFDHSPTTHPSEFTSSNKLIQCWFEIGVQIRKGVKSRKH
jgi:hypothetical protein